MRFINIFGSSHTSLRHGLPATLHTQFSQMDKNFKSRYLIGEIKSCPGATFCHDQYLDSVLKVLRDQSDKSEYEGQVNVCILGSNDNREIYNLPCDLVNQAFDKFKHQLSQFLDNLFRIENSTVIFVSTVMPKRSININLEIIADQVIRYLFSILLVNINLNTLRSKGENRAKRISVNLEDDCFKDGIHLNFKGNNILMAAILKSVMFIPKKNFLNSNNSPNLKLTDLVEFPHLSAKRALPPDNNTEKMPKFPSAKKFKKLSMLSPNSVDNFQTSYHPEALARDLSEQHNLAGDHQSDNTSKQQLKETCHQQTLQSCHPRYQQPMQPKQYSHPGNQQPRQAYTLTKEVLIDSRIPYSFPFHPPPFTTNSIGIPAPFSHNTENVSEVSWNAIREEKHQIPSDTNYEEIAGDLFGTEIPGSFCQAVSKDLKMSKGIAVKFKETFKDLKSLKMKNIAKLKGVGGVAILRQNKKFVYNLITKEHYYQRPVTLKNLQKCLQKMRNHARAHGGEKNQHAQDMLRVGWPSMERCK